MKTLTIEIKKIGINGEGIGYLNKKPVFVDGALPFELVEITNVVDFKTYHKAKLLKVINANTHRVTPPCSIAHECGACSLMHADQHLQEQIKIENLKQALNKYARIRPSSIVFHSNPNFVGYRNQGDFILGTNFGKIASGLFSTTSNRWIPIEHCIINDPLLEVIRKQVVALLNKHKVSIALKVNEPGYRYLIIRVINQLAQVSLISTTQRDDKQLYAEIGALEHVEGVYLSINNQKRGDYFGEETKVVAKRTWLEVTIDGIKLSVPPEATMLPNTKVASLMMKHVLSLIKPNDNVVEAYCGIGLMSLLVASKAKHVFGFDSNKSAINSAKHHAIANNITHAHFKWVDAKLGLKEATKKFNKYTLLVNPPRMGLGDAILNEVLRSKVAQIIYVSSNPSTLAKDVALLKERYNIRSIEAFDMLSHTPHVECVALMSRIKE